MLVISCIWYVSAAWAQERTPEQMQLLPRSPVQLGLSSASKWRFSLPTVLPKPLRARLEGENLYILESISTAALSGGLGVKEIATELGRAEIFDDGVSVYVTWYPSRAYDSRKDQIPSIQLECPQEARELRIEPLRKVIREPESVVFVLDASGSMQGTKIESAKKALASAASKLPGKSESALVVLYDCSLVERLCDFTRDSSELIDKSKDIQATGGTPLGDAMSDAFDYLKSRAFYPANRRRIIVLSDGVSTCGVDPFTVADGWQKNKVPPGFAIVGLELDENSSQTLKELAMRAQGEYIEATEETIENAMLQAITPSNKEVKGTDK